MKQYTRLFIGIGLLFTVYKEIRSTEVKTDIPVIYAVAGDVATIPCYVSSPVEDDEATMILWYRLDMPNPIYTLDIRNVPFKVARHFPAKEMDGRLKFNVNIHPPVLYITPVKREDEAEYKCRVDLRRARTLILHSRLVIIVPPSDPIIMDEHGQRVHGIVGPYDEGTRVVLICDVDGGDPPPTVTWWRGAILLDDEFIVTKRGFARNILTIPKIEREDLLVELSCQASNTNISTPRETRVRLDINLYPLSVSIDEPKYPLLAGEPYDIICETIGSRPRAITTWLLDDSKVGPGLIGTSKQHGNITSSIFRFIPKPEHNGKRLTCKSLNPSLANVTMESEMLLKVHFVPILNISLGKPLNTSDIVEGANVSIDCTVWANPKMSEVSWLFNERVIAVNKTEKSVTSKFTLDLSKVSRKQGGKYRCLASNSVGQGSSSNFYLLVKYIPVCRHTYTKIYGVAESESVTVKCEVDAEPQDVIFRWSLMNDFETVVLQNFTANDTNSTITYSPRAENGYGMLSCWGRNSVGLQLDPCLIKIVPAGAPESPHGCIAVNQTIINLAVECEPGYNGSLFQIFHMEIYDSVIEHLEQNLTKIDRPIFAVNGLTPGTTYLMVIYASNVKGRSQTVALMASTLLPAEKRTESTEEDIAVFSPLVIIVIAVLAFFAVGIVITILILKIHKSKRNSKKDTNTQDQISNSETTKKELDDSNDTNGKGPDIIPFTIEAEVNKMGDQLQYLSSQESSPKIPIRQKYTHTVL